MRARQAAAAAAPSCPHRQGAPHSKTSTLACPSSPPPLPQVAVISSAPNATPLGLYATAVKECRCVRSPALSTLQGCLPACLPAAPPPVPPPLLSLLPQLQGAGPHAGSHGPAAGGRAGGRALPGAVLKRLACTLAGWAPRGACPWCAVAACTMPPSLPLPARLPLERRAARRCRCLGRRCRPRRTPTTTCTLTQAWQAQSTSLPAAPAAARPACPWA